MSEDKREEIERIERRIESIAFELRDDMEINGERSLALKETREALKQQAAELRVELKEDDEDVSVFGSLHKLEMALRYGQPIFDYNMKPLPDAGRNQIAMALHALRSQLSKDVIDNGGISAPSLRNPTNSSLFPRTP